MKFATKIFITIFISTAFVIGGMSVITHYWISDFQMQASIRHEKELAMLVALKSEEYVLRNDLVELFKFYRSIVEVDPYLEYLFTAKNNEVLVHTFDQGVPRGLLALDALEDPLKIDIVPVENNHGDIIYHMRIGLSAPAHTTLHLGISNGKIHAELKPYVNMMMLVGGVLLATIPFGLALFLSRLVSRPIVALRKGVERIGSGELDYRLTLSTGDEIEQLVNDINTMAERIENLRDGMEAEIAERIQAEANLARQTELLNNILNNVPHNVFWKDQQSMYLGCNKAFAAFAGLATAANVVGKTDDDLPWRKGESEFYRQCDREVIATGVPMVDIENTLTQADGQGKTVITSIVPLKDQDGSIAGVLGIHHDITDRKRMEETLKQTQKMEAIGTLAGGVAHDFNNILGSIIGYTELAMDETEQMPLACDHLQQVMKSALRAKDLVRQILTFSRKSQDIRRPIQLALIVKEEAKMLRSTLPTTLDIRQRIDDEAGMVNADPTRLHQIVMNLCTNAAHAMAGGEGRLEISLTAISIDADSDAQKYHDVSPGPYMELKISDTGSGIDSRIIHRIFEPFFTTKEKNKGTGMGLAVVHGIVRDYGGNIIVESCLGKGATFTVLLPRVVSAPVRAESTRSEAALKGRERILFVDDEKTLLDLGQKTLRSLGYQVTGANGSLEAFKAYQRAPDAFDVVITDQTMPHLTGYNLAKQILEINPSARIILCTGYSETITPENIRTAGIKDLLYKPISKKQFASSIRKVLEQ